MQIVARKKYLKGTTSRWEEKKKDRSNLEMQTFEISKPLKDRLSTRAKKLDITLSACIRDILEKFFEEKTI